MKSRIENPRRGKIWFATIAAILILGPTYGLGILGTGTMLLHLGIQEEIYGLMILGGIITATFILTISLFFKLIPNKRRGEERRE